MGFGNRSFRGGSGGRGGGGGGRGFHGGGARGGGYDQGPPEQVVEVGRFTNTCENDIVCLTTCGKIPYFNAPVYFENKEIIGKIDEIFGSPKDNGFSVKLSDGIKAASFKEEQIIYINPVKLLPIERFINPQKGNSGGRGRGRGGGGRGRGGGERSGGGGFRGGRGGPRGGGGGFRGGNNGNGSFRGGSRGNESFRGRGGSNFGGNKRHYDSGNRNSDGGGGKRFRQN